MLNTDCRFQNSVFAVLCPSFCGFHKILYLASTVAVLEVTGVLRVIQAAKSLLKNQTSKHRNDWLSQEGLQLFILSECLDCLEIDVCIFMPIGPARVKQGTPEGKLNVIKIGRIKEKL